MTKQQLDDLLQEQWIKRWNEKNKQKPKQKSSWLLKIFKRKK
nr:MAG TPA: hypothetical protein [Caudoviricetes sp.]